MLRYLLVQDWDLDDDGKPETLRLLLRHSETLARRRQDHQVERAPTAFGPVSAWLESRLSQGEVLVTLEPPRRNVPHQSFLRVRLPGGWKVASAELGSRTIPVENNGTLDISAVREPATIRVKVSPESSR